MKRNMRRLLHARLDLVETYVPHSPEGITIATVFRAIPGIHDGDHLLEKFLRRVSSFTTEKSHDRLCTLAR